MNYRFHISENAVESIRSLPYFQSSVYHDLDISATLDFFFKRYVHSLEKLFDIQESIAVDCGAGHGWFSFAYILAGGKGVIAVDIDVERIQMAKKIAEILSIEDKIEFIKSPIHTIPFSTNEIDIFVSIETLEHVGKRNIGASLKKICNVTSQGVLITTPNKIFPIIAHDTRLPFAHWLPPSLRRGYAKVFNREDLDDENEFLSPLDVRCLLEKFEPATSCLTFQTFMEFKNHYPFYLPYGSSETQRIKTKPSALKSAYYWMASILFRKNSYWVMPNMAHVFIRRDYLDANIDY